MYELTVDEVAFICCGLRDLADAAQKRLDEALKTCEFPNISHEVEELIIMEQDLVRENREMADALEAQQTLIFGR